jgi:phosphoribosylglycinamide formyltransferase-1
LVRGLDAFKWAVRDEYPIGNTLHFIDAEADAGSVIHQEITPLYADDSIESFAERHYQMEIDMIANFPKYLSGGHKLGYPVAEPRKRMPKAIEAEMLDNFPAYRQKFAAKGE